MKTTIHVAAAQLATLIALTVLFSALPDTAHAAESKLPSQASTMLARGAGYELPNGTQQVRRLQRQLRRLGQRPGPIDGLFGPLTEAAVLRYQAQAGLPADGVVGPRTTTRLARSMARIHRGDARRQRLERRRHQAHRALMNSRPAAVQSGGRELDQNPPAATDRGPVGQTGDAAALLTGSLIALCLAAAFVLLSTRRQTPRASEARGREDAPQEPMAPATAPAAVPWLGPEEHDRDEVEEPLTALATARPGPRRSEPAPASSASRVPTDSQPAGPTAARGLGPEDTPVIGYVTVGEEERLELGDGYAAQAQAIRAFCRLNGLRLVRIVRDVVPAGGRSAPTPGLQHALEALARSEACALVVQDLGRLTHTPGRLAVLLRWLDDAERALIAIESELDTSSPIGRKTAKALVEVGDWDRQRAVDRRARNRNHRGAGGRPAVRDRPALHAHIAAMREQGLSLHAIADRLNAEGVPTLRGGARWRASSVQAAVGYKRPTERDVTEGLRFPEPPSVAADEEEA